MMSYINIFIFLLLANICYSQSNLEAFYTNAIKSRNIEQISKGIENILKANIEKYKKIDTIIAAYETLSKGDNSKSITPNAELAEKIIDIAEKSDLSKDIFTSLAMCSETETDYIRFADVVLKSSDKVCIFEQARFHMSVDRLEWFCNKYIHYPSAAYTLAVLYIATERYGKAADLLQKIKDCEHLANANILLAGLYFDGLGIEKSEIEAEKSILNARKRIVFSRIDNEDTYDCFFLNIFSSNKGYSFSESSRYKILKYTIDNIPESRKELSGDCLNLAKRLKVSSNDIDVIIAYIESNLSRHNMSAIFKMQISEKRYDKAENIAKEMLKIEDKPSIEFMSLPMMYCAEIIEGKSGLDGIDLLNEALKSKDKSTWSYASILLAQMYWRGTNGLTQDREKSVKLIEEVDFSDFRNSDLFTQYQEELFFPKDAEFAAILAWFKIQDSIFNIEEILTNSIEEINYESISTWDSALKKALIIEKFYKENVYKSANANLALALLYRKCICIRNSKLYFKYLKNFCISATLNESNLNYGRLCLACAYLEGYGTACNPIKAYKIFEELSSCKESDVSLYQTAAKEMRAYCLSKGIGVDKNLQEADNLRKEIIALNANWIYDNFQQMYLFGTTEFFFPYDVEMSKYWHSIQKKNY